MVHFIREGDLENICVRCRSREMNNKKSHFHGHNHYISFTCQNCGYETFIKTKHFSSGI